MTYQAVIGLEIHVQLKTKSKIFSGASTSFGNEPNTQACLLYTSPSPRDAHESRMPSSA